MSDVIEVRIEDATFVCCHGVVGEAYAIWHESMTRPCIHLMRAMPHVMLFDRTFVHQFGFQPVVSTVGTPAIVSREGDVVTLKFDKIGPIGDCHNNPKSPLKAAAIHRFRLSDMRWWDEENTCAAIVVGVHEEELS